jgi:ribosomal protein S18 acetylase RimI-like enzyme
VPSDRSLTFLIDSNIFITLEPIIDAPTTEPFSLAARFVRTVHRHGHRIALHERSQDDLLRDADEGRRRHRLRVLEKYLVLRDVPVSDRFAAAFSGRNENDAVDGAIASSLDANAADFLVTEDKRLRRRIAPVAPNLAERVLSLARAVELLDVLYPEPGQPPPRVERKKCYRLALTDPIFDSIRVDYAAFDSWFTENCQRGHRDAFVVGGTDGGIAALCILKDEDDDEHGLPRRRMKLCTLKVAEAARGQRLGELLVKAALLDAIERGLSGLSLTVYEKHTDLISMLTELGFADTGATTSLGERVLFRSVTPPPGAELQFDGFEFNRRYGPHAVRVDVPIHILPIQPRWEERLFPEGREQAELFSQYYACGNGIRKAYLSQARSRAIAPGDLLLFYRSWDYRAVRFVAVLEDAITSSDAQTIAAFVGTRTVYRAEDIQAMTENGSREVLVIRMRQARQLDPSWSFSQLVRVGVLSAAPQRIQSVSGEGAEWVRSQLAG